MEEYERLRYAAEGDVALGTRVVFDELLSRAKLPAAVATSPSVRFIEPLVLEHETPPATVIVGAVGIHPDLVSLPRKRESISPALQRRAKRLAPYARESSALSNLKADI